MPCYRMQYRSQQTFYFPQAADNVLRILAVLTTAFLAQTVATTFFYDNPFVFYSTHALTVGPSFQFSQLVTHWFLFPYDFFSGIWRLLLYYGLLMWFFGSELERTWGSPAFLRFVFVCLLGALVFQILFALIPGIPAVAYTGIEGATGGILAAYAMLWPNRKVLLFFFLPVKMKWLVLGIIVITMIFGWPGVVAQYGGGMIAATLFLYYYARKGKSSMFDGTLEQSSSRSSSQPSRGWRETYSDYQKKKRLKKKQEEINRRIEMKDEVDRLLEKISREGMDSLSRKEKAFLDQASKEF